MLEGLPPNNAAHRMTLVCDEASAKAIADIIVETFDPATTAAAAFENTVRPTTWIGGGPWTVDIFFGRSPDQVTVRALVAAVAGDAIAETADFSTTEQRDWVATSLEGLQPVRVGRFVIHGRHSREAVNVGDIGIEIEAALAFGTGHHGTTRGCLAAIETIARRRRPCRILDVGTGTGVLAIAAARRLHHRVAASDIDPVAVKAARENARMNAAGALVRPVVATGVRHRNLRSGSPYDLVLANILARPLRRLAPVLRPLVAPGGDVILSGLLTSDVPSVLSAYRAQQFHFIARRDLEGWATLHLRRPFSSFAVSQRPARSGRG